jgi:hypothetical protein
MSAQRHVRRLRLACAREDQARHGKILLEDALRTASFGDEGRLIVVRRLDLGRVPARASATQWSRRLEESYRNLRTPPVYVGQAGAERASAVYFATAQEPWLLLAERTALGKTCEEWYWASAVPGWKPHLGSTETLRWSFRRLVRGGLGLTLQLGVRLAERAALAPLLQALTPEDFVPLQSALGFRPNASLVAPFTPVSAPGTDDVFVDDIRIHWLAAVTLALKQLTLSGTTAPVAPAGEEIRKLARRGGRILEKLEFWPSDIGKETDASAVPADPPARAAGGEKSAAESADRSREQPENERVFTRAGGLFFLLPLLARAGLPEFAASLPEAQRRNLPWQILRLALRHAKIEESDPLRSQLAGLPSANIPLGRWLVVANRQALRLTQLNLRQLVLRPALVSVSLSHVDVFFRPNDADLRVRRAGLDLDPGWVPWLERIVSYHFNRED